ncbi:YxeA family protein [Bacillus sp. es.036]|uniref:YxeA family protein n=1 Tax=Bacillus sp. es.036 TaxID=1761764 RepID=UPI000BF83F56|nr:YxeA family protein [Bacillus sp. es.036]PFG14494.1 uncharacterized protein (TIGR01655 family) [Bacillus sp. es.036]
MKRIWIPIIASFFIGGLLFLQNTNLNRLGADTYFTKINVNGELEETSSNGEIYIRYRYELPAYNEAGESQSFTFTSPGELRENAYLLLYIKGDKGVTSYEEVDEREIPQKAKEQLL